jgi:hypothetical protein
MSFSSQIRFVHDPVKIAITRLSDDEIHSMDREDLLDVVRLSRGLRAQRDLPRPLHECDYDILQDFAINARERCREEMGVKQRGQRRPPMFSA